MAKNKYIRSMNMVGASQQVVEKAVTDKFAAVEELAQLKPTKVTQEPILGRINPQLSCTITPQDKELLNTLALYVSNRENKVLNTSTIIRALIRLGDKYKEEIEI
jgi:ferritin